MSGVSSAIDRALRPSIELDRFVFLSIVPPHGFGRE
jgi:hypothetical protein